MVRLKIVIEAPNTKPVNMVQVTQWLGVHSAVFVPTWDYKNSAASEEMFGNGYPKVWYRVFFGGSNYDSFVARAEARGARPSK